MFNNNLFCFIFQKLQLIPCARVNKHQWRFQIRRGESKVLVILFTFEEKGQGLLLNISIFNLHPRRLLGSRSTTRGGNQEGGGEQEDGEREGEVEEERENAEDLVCVFAHLFVNNTGLF